MNKSLLSGPTDRDIIAASNARLRSSQTENWRVSFGEFKRNGIATGLCPLR
jgi:hypothetical protein